jgi:ribosome recycling factor
MIDDAVKMAKDAMDKAKERLGRELARVRTGRASPALLDDIRVEAYGTPMPLNQLATISAADARLLVIKPYDVSNLPSIERAIRASNLGVNPSSDGVVVRVPIPPLTMERRRDLVKQIKEFAEEAKIGIRNARREANDFLKEAEKDKDISEDQLKKGLEKVQALTDDYIKQVDGTVAKKENEITNE